MRLWRKNQADRDTPRAARGHDPISVAESFNNSQVMPPAQGPWPDAEPVERVPRRPSPGPESVVAVAPVRKPISEPDRGWSIGDAGRAFAEVEPILGDSSEGPDTIADGGVVGSAYVLAASVRGLSHRQKGTPRQDSYGFAVTEDRRWLVVVVADGVSSGRLSHRAAQLVTRQGPGLVAAEFERWPDLAELDWYKIFEQLASRILGIGLKLLAADGVTDPKPEDVPAAMATTAVIAVLELEPTGPRRQVFVAWQGDSPAWVLHRRGWHCLTEVKNLNKEVASSSVMALPRLPSEADKVLCDHVSIPLDATLLVMTDGVGDPLGAADGDVASALAEAWQAPPTVFRFAEQVAFGRKSFDDDRTVVAVWSRTGP